MSHEHDTYGMTLFGFWLYLLTDAIMFAVLFAAYAVLKTKTFGGPSANELFTLELPLQQSLLLATASFTAPLALMGHKKGRIFFWYGVTFLLGALFLTLTWEHFSELIQRGFSWQRSAFLSAFFTLVATHAIHLLFALLWTLVLLAPLFKRPFSAVDERRLTCLRMFWQFLNGVWVVIFTYVYLLKGV